MTEPITKTVGNFKRRYGYTTSDRHRERRGTPKEPNDSQDDEQLALEIDEPARRAPKWVSKDLSA
ncbi:MAG: hypothetical protein ACRDI1_01175 [Actinomycetota bacterium]